MMKRDDTAEFSSSLCIGDQRQNKETNKTILKIIERVTSVKDGFKMGCIDGYSKTDMFPRNTNQFTQAQQSMPSKGSHVPGSSPRLFRKAMAYVDTLHAAGIYVMVFKKGIPNPKCVWEKTPLDTK